MRDAVASLSRRTSLAALWIANLGLIVMTAIIIWQVFARYVLNASPAWGEPAALLLMIWYVMLAAAAGVRENFHIRITVFAAALPPRPRMLAALAMHLAVGAFGLAMIWWGTELTLATWEHVIPTLGLPRGVAYIPLPLAGLLILLFSAEQMAAVVEEREVPPAWN